MKPKHRAPVLLAALDELPHFALIDYKDIASAWTRAQRFIFNEDASTRMGWIIGEAETLLLENHQFAIPPYPTTYMEINCRLLYAAAGKVIENPFIPGEDEDGRDDWVGYLIDRGRMWTFSRTVSGHAGMGPLRYEDSLGHASFWPKAFSDADFGSIGPEWGRLALLFGTGIHAIRYEDTRQELLQRFTIHPAFQDPVHAKSDPEHRFEPLYSSWSTLACSMGDVRNIIAMLLVLNTPRHVVLQAQQPRPFLYKGRRVTYGSHRTVHINLGERTEVRRLWHGHSGIRHKRHPVRGHWVHYQLQEGCDHDWPAIPENEVEGSPRWTCGLCGGHRTWRKHHERGDASLGYVTHDYAIGTGAHR